MAPRKLFVQRADACGRVEGNIEEHGTASAPGALRGLSPQHACMLLAREPGGLRVLSQSSIFGQNPKLWHQEFNDLQTPKLSKEQLCDRTPGRPPQSEGAQHRGAHLA
jgi:hypothetical protein